MTSLQSRQALILYAEVGRSSSLGKIIALLHCLVLHQTFGQFSIRIMLEASCSAVKSGLCGSTWVLSTSLSPHDAWGWVWCQKFASLQIFTIFVCSYVQAQFYPLRVHPRIAKSCGRISVLYAC